MIGRREFITLLSQSQLRDVQEGPLQRPVDLHG